ncbi:MAG TPA: aminotransferase class V-fold PLP-dependent enzyme, partial [Pirellulaceae bacterium]
MGVTLESVLDPYRLRRDFPILAHPARDGKPLVYLDNAATTQRPRAVIDAVVSTYERSYANVHRGIHWLSDQSTDLYEQARERVRNFLNARSSAEIIFTTGTTSSINLVARAWGDAHVHAGDEIILSEMEHHSNLVPWHQLCARVGCVVRPWPVTDEGLLDFEQLPQLLNSKTRMLAVTAVSNVLGTINPVPRIVEAARSVGALVLIDAAQAVPHEVVDVQAWGADFVAFSGHKMLGPSGVGVLYGREAVLDAMPPFLG